MSAKSESVRRRVGDYNPAAESGDLLETIEGQEVEILAVEQLARSGRNGAYTLTILTLASGTKVHTGSPVVAEQFAAVPLDAYPVWATFTRQRSQNDPTRSYWTAS
jgi:hypothetical protein